jgi:hypothetical protein
MKRKCFGMMVLLVVGLALIGCPTDSGGSGDDNNNSNNSGNNNNSNGNDNNNNGNNNNSGGSLFVGTWVGSVQGSQATVVISSGNTWSLSVPSDGFSDSGSYSGSGAVATLTSNNARGRVVGTATASVNVAGNVTISLVLNQNSVAPGTYTLTKQ